MIEVSAQEIITALGQDREDKNKTTCPICAGKMSVSDKNGKILLNCWGNPEDKAHRVEIIKNLRERGLWPEREQQQAYQNKPKNGQMAKKTTVKPEEPYRPQDDPDEIPAEKLIPWRKSSNKKEDLGLFASYMASRGVPLDPDEIPAAVRYGEYENKDGEQVRVVVYAVTNLEDKNVHACHRTFLREKEDGSVKKEGSRAKGRVKGRGVWFDRKRDHKEVAVGEGCETVLSVRKALEGKMSCCAALSAVGMTNLILPEETEVLFILADSDPSNKKPPFTGQNAAIKKAEMFEASRPGRIAWLVAPCDSCFSDEAEKLDFNDLNSEQIIERFSKKIRVADLEWRPKMQEQKGNKSLPKDTLEALHNLNKNYAAVVLGNDFRIIWEGYDREEKKHTLSFLKKTAFYDYYANQYCKVETEQGPEWRELSKLWMTWRERRTYNNVAFDPSGKSDHNTYNLFRGFPLKPKQGDWSLMRKLMLDVICKGNQQHYDYLIAWMARLVQKPGGDKPGVAIVFKGKKGIGKGVFVNYFGAIFGEAFLPIADSESFTGRFNMHLSKSLLVFLDEAVWGGNKQAEGKLKQLITEPTILFEPKGVDALTLRSHINVIIASNEDWVVPATGDERRYFVLNPSEEFRKNTNYFGKIIQERDNGGIEAMMHDLLQHDYSGVDLRKAPITEGLCDQVEMSLPTHTGFWHSVLSRGYLLSCWDTKKPIQSKAETSYTEDFWGTRYFKHEVYREYNDIFCRGKNDKYPAAESKFWKNAREIFTIQDIRLTIDARRIRAIKLPDLEVARTLFTHATGIKFEGDEVLCDDETDFQPKPFNGEF